MSSDTPQGGRFGALLQSANPKYRLAAIVYVIYGVIYMTGATHLGLTGASSRAAASGSWMWYVAGILILVSFPLLINRGFKWFCRFLVFFLCYRIYGLVSIMSGPAAADLVALPILGEVSKLVGAVLFAVMAAITAGSVARAAWDL
ncbi:MAG: hypothetical protein ACPGU1_13740 [Myxococcota bacterium]